MTNFTNADVRAAVLSSMDLAETDLGTGSLTVLSFGHDLPGGWMVVYGDSGGTFEAAVTVETGPEGEYLLVEWGDELEG